jgi:hypothetical protein
MTTQAQLDKVVEELLAKCENGPFFSQPAKISLSQLSELWNLLPHFGSLWIDDWRTVYEYSRVYHSINDMIEGKIDPDGWIIDHRRLQMIRSVSVFSRDGVIRHYELDILLVRKLAGEAVDVCKFDRREIVFHKQQLLVAELATGAWSSNGSYVFDLELRSLTPRGHDLLSRVNMAQIPGQQAVIVQQFYGSVQMRDQYNVIGSSTGVVGPNAHIDSNFQQIWNQYSGDRDLNALAVELASLRAEMRRLAVDVKQDQATAEVGAAEEAAKHQDGGKVMRHLSAAGDWALSVAKNASKTLAEKALEVAIKAATGL